MMTKDEQGLAAGNFFHARLDHSATGRQSALLAFCAAKPRCVNTENANV
jgi:hypothetical protein